MIGITFISDLKHSDRLSTKRSLWLVELGRSEMNNWDYLEIEDLSGSVREVANVIGFETTKTLMQILPLEGLYIPKNRDLVTQELVEALDEMAIARLVKFYGGETLVLGTKWALAKARNRRIRLKAQQEMSLFSSKSKYYAQVAADEGLSLVRVRQLLSAA